MALFKFILESHSRLPIPQFYGFHNSFKLLENLCENSSNIANETYVDKLSSNKSLVKSNIIYANLAKNAWRIPLL